MQMRNSYGEEVKVVWENGGSNRNRWHVWISVQIPQASVVPSPSVVRPLETQQRKRLHNDGHAFTLLASLFRCFSVPELAPGFSAAFQMGAIQLL